MTIPIYQADAFTDRPFAGNTAAVCILPVPAPAKWMQGLALEMNLAETAFLVSLGGAYGLRWFTPATEVDLCGHATLASAHILWETGRLLLDAAAQFDTRSGILTAQRIAEGIELDFPAQPAENTVIPDGLEAALGARVMAVGRNRFDLLAEVTDATVLRSLQPDMRALVQFAPRGIIVTCVSDDPRYDFLSRFFAPAAGIDEDPVTGSAHCCLGPYWQARIGRDTLRGYQASARGGEVGVRIAGDRVKLIGRAVTVFSGSLAEPAIRAQEQSDAR